MFTLSAITACSLSDKNGEDSIAFVLDTKPRSRSVTLTWTNTGAQSFNLYFFNEPDCAIINYTSCDGGTRVTDVKSPYTVNGLTNGQNYWFKVESVANDGNATSNEAGARPNPLKPNSTVLATAVGDDGTVYLGGKFTGFGIVTGGGVSLSTKTGRPGLFPVVVGPIFAAVTDGAGGYYIGGGFTLVGGQRRNHLAHILANGTLSAWNPEVDNEVTLLAVSGGTVYIGGKFSRINDQSRRYLAAIDASGNVTDWNPNLVGSETAEISRVVALAVSGNSVYVSYGLASSDNYRVTAIDANNGADVTWSWKTLGMATALAVSGNTVYIGGFFSALVNTLTRDRVERYNLAAVDLNGNLTAWDPHADGGVNTLAVFGNTVYVGGQFRGFGRGLGQRYDYRPLLAAIDLDGNVTDWNSGNPITHGIQPLSHGIEGTVLDLAVSGDTVYVGGTFTKFDEGRVERNRLVAIDLDGNITAWNPNANGRVSVLAASNDTVFAGGDFDVVGEADLKRNHLGAIDSEGNLTAWNPNANNAVYALKASGGIVYAGGDFTAFNEGSVTRNRLAAIDLSGNVTGWNPDSNGTVRDLAVSSGTVYAAGDFTAFNEGDVRRNKLAAFDLDGSATAWNPSPNDTVHALTVSNGTVYAGGSFTAFYDGSITRNHLAAIDLDGNITAWNPEANREVYSLAVYGDTVYAGGRFTTIRGVPRDLIAAINLDGQATEWNPGRDTYYRSDYLPYYSDPVYTLVVTDDTVYAGGASEACHCVLAAFDRHGANGSYSPTIWRSIDPNKMNVSGSAATLGFSGGKLYVGGSFTYLNGDFAPYLSVIQ